MLAENFAWVTFHSPLGAYGPAVMAEYVREQPHQRLARRRAAAGDRDPGEARRLRFQGYLGVTDGARTRGLRSHSPAL